MKDLLAKEIARIAKECAIRNRQFDTKVEMLTAALSEFGEFVIKQAAEVRPAARFQHSWTLIEECDIFTCEGCKKYFYMRQPSTPNFCAHCGAAAILSMSVKSEKVRP